MRRVYVEKITQYGVEYYIGKIDPRVLVRMAKELQVASTQDAQRPLQEKKLFQIRDHVFDEGLLPNTLVLATCNDLIEFKKIDLVDDAGTDLNMYYFEVPVTEDEFIKYKDSIEAMDGQHRLYSFKEQYCKMNNNIDYEIGFTIFSLPSLKEQREIFLICNEKQDKVASNLLMYFKEKLSMLAGAEKKYYAIVNRLSSENKSPLQGRIIMSAEKIKNGIKAQQLIKVFDAVKISELSYSSNGVITHLTDNQIFDMLCSYFKGWEKAISFKFSKPKKEDGAAYKIAGIRFMITMIDAFWDRSVKMKQKFSAEFVEQTIKQMLSIQGIAPTDLFTGDNSDMFRERSNTVKYAETCAEIIKKIESQEFNPLS